MPRAAKPRSWALNNLAQTVGRSMIALLFIVSIVYNLTHLDDAAARMVANGFKHGQSIARILIICAMTISSLGTISLLYNSSSATYLLLAFLLPVTVSEHLLPVISMFAKSGTIDSALFSQLTSLLKNVSLMGALIVIGCLQRRLAWSESSRKEEIRVALAEFFAQQSKEVKKSK